MTRIGGINPGTGVSLLNNLQDAYRALDDSSLRLATLRRVNRGSDDPAALIAIGSIESELSSLEAANRATNRAAGMLQTADYALGQIGGLLDELQGHAVAAADTTLSDAERGALQIEADSAVDAINQIARSTQFGGRALLDGSGEFHFTLGSDTGEQATFNLAEVASSTLGAFASGSDALDTLRTGGRANIMSGDHTLAAEVIHRAQQQIGDMRIRVGAFERYTLGAAQSVQSAIEVNLTGALSDLRDVDVAAETARFVQSRVRRDASLGALLFADRTRRSALSLLLR
jgi:flagellin-like hook-associated protein FlgL